MVALVEGYKDPKPHGTLNMALEAGHPNSENSVAVVADVDATDSGLEPPPTTDHLYRAKPGRPEPTHYGDWERDGRCIDF